MKTKSKMTWQEIQKTYPQQWLGLKNVKKDTNGKIVTASVAYQGYLRADLEDMLKKGKDIFELTYTEEKDSSLFRANMEVEFLHVMTENELLIGIPKYDECGEDVTEYDAEDLSAYIDMYVTTAKLYDQDIIEKVLKLEPRLRTAILETIETWNTKPASESAQKTVPINGVNWRIVLDFILDKYNVNLNSITQQMAYGTAMTAKTIYDRLNSITEKNERINKTTLEDIKDICYRYGITYETIETCKGYCCILDPQIKAKNKLSMKKVQEYRRENPKSSVKTTLAQLYGVEEKDIVELPLRIVNHYQKIDPKIKEFLFLLIEELSTRDM